MKRSEALPSKYLSKEDLDKPILVTIANVHMDYVEGSERSEDKPVMTFKEKIKPMILNHTNWSVLEEVVGSDDSDDWIGQKIVVYHDPSVMFGGKRVGGIRLRAPKNVKQHEPEPPPPADDDVPF